MAGRRAVEVMAGYDLERDARFDRCLKPFRPGSSTGRPQTRPTGLFTDRTGSNPAVSSRAPCIRSQPPDITLGSTHPRRPEPGHGPRCPSPRCRGQSGRRSESPIRRRATVQPQQKTSTRVQPETRRQNESSTAWTGTPSGESKAAREWERPTIPSTLAHHLSSSFNIRSMSS